MNWQPGASVATAQTRAAMLQRIRERFATQRVLEVQTPSLSRYAVTDVHIDSLSAVAPQLNQSFFLRTSPEYALKRLLAAGYPDIYEIGSVFRDGECGARHQPEFSMLEWYRHGFTLDAIVNDTVSTLHAALQPLLSSGVVNKTVDRRTYDQWLQHVIGKDSDCAIEDLQAHLPDDFPDSLVNDRQAILNWLFDRHVAGAMSGERLSVVTHYPAAQAALACLDDTGTRALRFEIYLGELELANGFVELTDADEQRARFQRDQATRDAQGRNVPEIDQPFIAALVAGLPACAGVAVGVDRLMMLLRGSDHIGDVVSFTHPQG